VTPHHVVEGDPAAPPIVLSASLGTPHALWDPQVPALARRLRVLRYDHRGHGASPVPPGPYDLRDLGRDVLDLLAAQGIERASFCGASLGGMTGMWLAACAPARVDRLVLVCTSAYLPPPEAWAERAAAVLEAGTTAVVADAVVARWLTPRYAAAHPELVARLERTLAATPAEGYAACCGAIARMDLRGDLRRIRAPTLVIAGADDRATPPEHAERIAAGIDGARLEILSPAAHLANLEQAEAVTRLILDHLEA
jgi:3-oxoadipate enol-lactonase